MSVPLLLLAGLVAWAVIYEWRRVVDTDLGQLDADQVAELVARHGGCRRG